MRPRAKLIQNNAIPTSNQCWPSRRTEHVATTSRCSYEIKQITIEGVRLVVNLASHAAYAWCGRKWHTAVTDDALKRPTWTHRPCGARQLDEWDEALSPGSKDTSPFLFLSNCERLA
jgi:hypothetical protein